MAFPLIRLARVDSTQAFLRRNPHLACCGVMAEAQSEGRGRQGNRWESAEGGGLWLSAALPPPAGIPPGLILQRAMGQAARILDPGGRTLGLKWPNDLVAWKEGHLVKLGGVIGEHSGGRLILGLGINVTSAPSLPGRPIPPACLREVGLPHPEMDTIAHAILQSWNRFETETKPAFLWPEAGTPLRWEAGQGSCLGWEPDGRLKVVTAAGIQRLSAGEITGLG